MACRSLRRVFLWGSFIQLRKYAAGQRDRNLWASPQRIGDTVVRPVDRAIRRVTQRPAASMPHLLCFVMLFIGKYGQLQTTYGRSIDSGTALYLVSSWC